MLKLGSIVFVVIASVGGCKKGDKGKAAAPEPTPSVPTATQQKPAEPAPTAPAPAAQDPAPVAPAASGAKCPDGQLGGGDIPFCIQLPAKWVANAPHVEGDYTDMEVTPEGGFGGTIYLRWGEALWDKYPDAFPGMVKELEDDAKDGKLLESGDLAGGKGKFVLYSATPKEKDQNIWFKSVFQATKFSVSCKGSWFTDKPTPEVAAACKSIAPQ